MKVIAATIAVLAILIAVVPLFTDCESQGQMISLPDGRQISMKCHWTGRAELALGLPLLGVGAVMVASRRKETYRSLSILGFVVGAMAVLLPTTLIGVCANPDMICNSTMKPALILLGVLIMGASVAGLVVSRGREAAGS